MERDICKRQKLDSIISEFYAEEKAPDIICTAYDGFAYAAEENFK